MCYEYSIGSPNPESPMVSGRAWHGHGTVPNTWQIDDWGTVDTKREAIREIASVLEVSQKSVAIHIGTREDSVFYVDGQRVKITYHPNQPAW